MSRPRSTKAAFDRWLSKHDAEVRFAAASPALKKKWGIKTPRKRKAATALSLTSKTNFREALRDAGKTTKSRLKGID